MNRPQVTIIALGGNALCRPEDPADSAAEFAQMQRSAEQIVDVLESGQRVVVTHGNGPQVGAALRRVELAAPHVHPQPLDACVAGTQGSMGYMICHCLDNALRRRGRPEHAAAVITRVRVDADDPGFREPTKPIGRNLSRQEAQAGAGYGWVTRMVAPDQFRRVVASPRPLEILEAKTIERLVAAGELVVACGGGGVPVVRTPGGDYAGVPAVVDKDLATALLARTLGADRLVILTGVERVAIRYGRADQRDLATMTAAEARGHLTAGEFPAGSMGPKIEAALDFLDHHAGGEVIITSPELMSAAMNGSVGTRIVSDCA